MKKSPRAALAQGGDAKLADLPAGAPAPAAQQEQPVPERKFTPMDEARFKGAEYGRETGKIAPLQGFARRVTRPQ